MNFQSQEEKPMIRPRILLAASLVTLLAACSSGVKLNDVPVEDRQPGSVAPGPGGGATSGDARTVAPVTAGLNPADAAGPANVARIVYFDYDSYVIKPQFQNIIEGHARFLKTNQQRRIVIEGHTDERGGREYNLALGQRRSEAVRRALGLLGVPDTQVEAVSFGKEKPASQGADETAWAQNRRAEIAYR
jgi:peptidoglycan-associated lipoprotein